MKPIMEEHKWLCTALKITLTWQFSSVHSPLYLLNCGQKLLWSIRTKVNNYVNIQNASTKPRSNAIRQTHSFAVQKQYKVKNNSSGKTEKSYSRIFSSICPSPSWSRNHLGPIVIMAQVIHERDRCCRKCENHFFYNFIPHCWLEDFFV